MDTDHFAQLIDAKFQVLGQLREVARRQREVIAARELSQLLTVLSAKQQLLTLLKKLDAQLTPYREQDPENRVWRSPADRQRCRDQADRCEAILREVLGWEKQAEHEMVRQRDEVSQQLQALEQSADAQRAYVQMPAAVAGSFDLTSEG